MLKRPECHLMMQHRIITPRMEGLPSRTDSGRSASGSIVCRDGWCAPLILKSHSDPSKMSAMQNAIETSRIHAAEESARPCEDKLALQSERNHLQRFVIGVLLRNMGAMDDPWPWDCVEKQARYPGGRVRKPGIPMNEMEDLFCIRKNVVFFFFLFFFLFPKTKKKNMYSGSCLKKQTRPWHNLEKVQMTGNYIHGISNSTCPVRWPRCAPPPGAVSFPRRLCVSVHIYMSTVHPTVREVWLLAFWRALLPVTSQKPGIGDATRRTW